MKRTRPILVITLAIVFVLVFNALPSFRLEVLSTPIPREQAQVSRSIKEEPTYHPIPLTQEQTIDLYVEEICANYGIDVALVKSIIWHESRYQPTATNGNCLGLMQISTRWHGPRAERLGVTDFYDPYGNILIGVDYLSALFKNNPDPKLVLMLYSMDNNTAYEMYQAGQLSNYAKSVLERANDIK